MAYINGKEVLFAPVNSSGGDDVVLQEEKAVEITANGSVEILPDEGCAAVKKVIANVNVPETIPEGYIDTADATATADDVAAGKTFYAGGSKKTGTMPEHSDSDFDINVSNGDSGELKIGYAASEKTYFPASEGALLGTIHDVNFIAENIKKDTSIFGVVGTYKGGTDSPLPLEVSTEAEMTALLTSGEVGGVYKYTGTTGTYENGALYVLEEELITFTIDGTSYQAEEGMTWGEWVASDYNTGGYSIGYADGIYGFVVNDGAGTVVNVEGQTAIITNGTAYTTYSAGPA